MTQTADLHTNTLEDVKQYGLWAALASLSYVFWVVGGMEMVERLAYYGVKAVATLYAKDPISKGGLGIDLSSFGIILAVWAFVQSFVPVVTGGLSDRLGYKETIFLSTIIKISGYLVMGFFPTFTGFFCGAVLLAFGTGIFKPGVQGTLVKATNRKNSSMAWGVFYQTVNIGGFLGPLVAAQLRQLAWHNVFFACAGIICFNFLLILIYKEPGKEERLSYRDKVRRGEVIQMPLWLDSLREIVKPTLLIYLLLFSGFWFMFNSLFDVLPAHIDDWVDTSTIVNTLFGPDGTTNWLAVNLLGMHQGGHYIQPEGLVNWDAGMIMLFCFLFAGWSGKLRAVDSMILGTLLCSASLWICGSSAAWFVALGIIVFAIGEMFSSPKFLEFLGNIAPSQKKAMYLGFSQLPLGIGWTLEGYFGPRWYDLWASKERFARELLVQRGMDLSQVQAIPKGEAFQHLVSFTGEPAKQLTQLLYNSHNVALVWYVMGAVGVVSAVGMYFYGRWVRGMAKSWSAGR